MRQRTVEMPARLGKRRGVNAPSTRALRGLLFALAAALASGCVSHRHVVGLGATGSSATTARQYYLFFGLVPLNTIDSQRMAPDLTSYSIETRFGVADLLLSPFLLPFTLTTRTVVVRT